MNADLTEIASPFMTSQGTLTQTKDLSSIHQGNAGSGLMLSCYLPVSEVMHGPELPAELMRKTFPEHHYEVIDGSNFIVVPLLPVMILSVYLACGSLIHQPRSPPDTTPLFLPGQDALGSLCVLPVPDLVILSDMGAWSQTEPACCWGWWPVLVWNKR